MRDTLVNCLMDRGIQIEAVLKRDQAYIMLGTESLVFKMQHRLLDQECPWIH